MQRGYGEFLHIELRAARRNAISRVHGLIISFKTVTYPYLTLARVEWMHIRKFYAPLIRIDARIRRHAKMTRMLYVLWYISYILRLLISQRHCLLRTVNCINRNTRHKMFFTWIIIITRIYIDPRYILVMCVCFFHLLVLFSGSLCACNVAMLLLPICIQFISCFSFRTYGFSRCMKFSNIFSVVRLLQNLWLLLFKSPYRSAVSLSSRRRLSSVSDRCQWNVDMNNVQLYMHRHIERETQTSKNIGSIRRKNDVRC